MTDFSTLIMAAGKGTRMKSNLAKVLHKINGRPMIHYVIDVAKQIDSQKIVLIVGHQKERVISECQEYNIDFAIQEQQLGTGHAVMMAQHLFNNYSGDLLILSGDVPLLTKNTLLKLTNTHKESNAIATLLTANLEDPTGYGRVIRSIEGPVKRIVEHKDANDEEKNITEINVGIYIFKAKTLFESLKLIKNDNAQGEYYLPDVVKLYVDKKEKVVAQLADNFEETNGINDINQLKNAETILMARSLIK
jgi:UDP-N-acetylglucosamine diphosphorylase/glucosamine-1-phosphate N-acetyltransferase